MLIDSHAHLNFSAFDADRQAVINRCRKKGMKVINIGSQLATSQKAVELADKGNDFYAAIGIHPIHIGEYQRDPLENTEHQLFEKMSVADMFDQMALLVKNKKVVAIGETGLDYFRLSSDIENTKKMQREYFLRHIELAQKNNLPVVIHCRGSQDDQFGAYDEILEILKDKKIRGVLHCFSADWKTAEKFLALGYYIGFTGAITFKKKNEELQAVVKQIPLEKVLIETDCPYITPEPHRGKRNEPVYVELVAKKIAELKYVTLEQVIEQTAQNAEKLFNL